MILKPVVQKTKHGGIFGLGELIGYTRGKTGPANGLSEHFGCDFLDSF
jgi:hypothetical protein